MGRGRVVRSKTGCQSCRRRKVRCDERKPVCSACTRLELICSFHPGVPASTVQSTRYRVRFVDSSYTGPRTRNNGLSKPLLKSSVPQQGTSSEDEGRCSQLNGVDPDSQVLTRNHGDNIPGNSPSSLFALGGSPHCTPSQIEQTCAESVDDSQTDLHGSHGDSGYYVPSSFDLNMNFDLLSDDWLLLPQAPAPTLAPESPSCQPQVAEPNTQENAVFITPQDHGLIQHYLNVMTRFTRIRSSGDENIYSQIFSNMALFYAPLYNAIMAWTALHLGQTRLDSDLIRKSEERYTHAISLMHQDPDVAHHFELSLITIWFALQFELLSARDVDSFCRHLEFAADLIYAHQRHQKAGGKAAPLGPIGSRILVWLGSYDARAAWIGKAGHLLQNLELFRSDFDFLDKEIPESGATTGAASLKLCLRLTVDLDTIEGRIANLHRRVFASPVATWSTVQSDLISLYRRLQEDDTTIPILSSVVENTRSLPSKITTKHFNSLLLLASFYSVVIGFHRALPDEVAANLQGKLFTAEMAAVRIVRIASCVCRFRPPSPQNIWPRILFMAGIETTDLVYQDWLLKTLSEAELWGVNVGKTRMLLENVIKRQSKLGSRVDYLDVMKESTGLFII